VRREGRVREEGCVRREGGVREEGCVRGVGGGGIIIRTMSLSK